MNISVSFPGKKQVDCKIKGFTVKTDQSKEHGGEESAPSPFDLFLCSLASCMGIFALSFAEKHGLSSADLELNLETKRDSKTRLIESIEVKINTKKPISTRVRKGLERAVSHCAVKKHLEQPPEFLVTVNEGEEQN